MDGSFTRSNQVTKCQDVSGFHPKLGTFSRNRGDPGTILESELGPLCPGPLVLHTCKAQKRLLQLDLGTSQAGGDQVDHARDVHSPQNPWLSLNRAPQITIFSILSRITSRLMDPSNLNSEFCDIKRETTVTTQLKQMPIRSKCPHVMFPRVGPNFPRFPAFHSKYPD